MPHPKKPKFAFALQVETEYEVSEVVARVVFRNESGELLSHPFEFGGFRVTAYLDRHGHLWGCSYLYAALRRVELRRAEAMVKVLRKINRELQKANSEQGCLADNDFAAYLFRIAAILGIRTYYIRDTTFGETFSVAKESTVQAWVRQLTAELGMQP